MPELPVGAIGHIDDFRDEAGQIDHDRLAGKHVDGPSGFVFETEEDYLNHTSPLSGATPRDIEHLEKTTTPEAGAIAEASIKRGDERREEEVHPAEAAAAEAGEPMNAE